VPRMFARIEQGLFAHLKPKVHSKEPWIVEFEEFIPRNMADDVLKAVGDSGLIYHHSLERSEQLYAQDPLTSQRRTSATSFCDRNSCLRDRRMLRVHDIATNITGLPFSNTEYVQMVRYQPGGAYTRHMDTSHHFSRTFAGHRIYTLLVYLTDVHPWQGGQTSFPKLGIEVQPRKGKAMLWANVLPDDVTKADERTEHQSLPLTAGLKEVANLWSYEFDWKGSEKRGCQGVAVHNEEGTTEGVADLHYAQQAMEERGSGPG